MPSSNSTVAINDELMAFPTVYLSSSSLTHSVLLRETIDEKRFTKLFWVLGLNGAAQSATCSKDSRDNGPFWFAGFDEVPQYAVNRVFVKNAKVAVGMNVNF